MSAEESVQSMIAQTIQISKRIMNFHQILLKEFFYGFRAGIVFCSLEIFLQIFDFSGIVKYYGSKFDIQTKIPKKTARRILFWNTSFYYHRLVLFGSQEIRKHKI